MNNALVQLQITSGKIVQRLLLLMVLLTAMQTARAQTILISPSGDGGFQNGTTFSSNGWTVTNGSVTNQWHLGTVPTGFPTRSAYISSNGGTTNAYSNSNTSVVHFWRDITFPAGETNIQLSFDWNVAGETDHWDAVMVHLAPVSYTPVATTTGLSTGTLSLPAVHLGSAWSGLAANPPVRSSTFLIPASLAGNCSASSTMRLIFSWKNDGSDGTTTPVAVDNITLTSGPSQIQSEGGVFTIDNTQPTAGTNFASFTQAIAALNARSSCGSVGAVVFNVQAGQTFVDTPPAITTEGTVSNPIIFQKSGVGANPLIAPPASAGTIDHGLAISGGDHITIDGIDVSSSTNTSMRFGILLRNSSATNGANNNTIRNCNITLNRTNTNSIGVICSASTTGGGLTPTAAGGANNQNLFENITVQNASRGVLITSGTTSFPATGNEVRNSTIGASYSGVPTGDIGTGTTAAYGIQFLNQSGGRIHNNIVRNIAASAINRGIFCDGARGLTVVSNNRVMGIRNTGTGSTSGQRGIECNGNSGGAEIRVFNNFVSDITAAFNGSATTTRVIQGVLFTSSAAAVSQLVDHNNVSINGGPLVSSICLEFTSSICINVVRNNVLANFTGAQTTAKHYIIRSATSTLGAGGSSSNYNDLFLVNTTNGFVGLVNTTDQATITNWSAAMGGAIDANSISADPQFFNVLNDLRISNGALAGASVPGTVPFIAHVTHDINGGIRPNPPALGAHEVTLLAQCSGAPQAGTISGTAFFCGSGSTTLNFTGETGVLGLSYQWASSTVPGGPQIQLGQGTSQATGTISSTTYYTVTTTCAQSGLSSVSPEFTLEVRPVPSASASNSGPGCVGESVLLSGTSDIGSSFTWTGPSNFTSTQQNPSVSPIVVASAGTYTFNTTHNGCTSGPATTIVSVNPPIAITSVTATPAVLCTGGSTQLNVATSILTANIYSFTTGTGASLDPMSGATSIIGSAVDDTPSTLHPIGFSFNFNGQGYTQFSLTPDGFIKLGTPVTTSQITNLVTSTTNIPKIYPYWDDIATGSNGSVSYVVTGTQPNRILKVQWFVRIPRAPLTDPANSTFQCWLYENGMIEFIYGAMNSATMSASVGITAGASNYQSVTLSGNTVSTTTANDNNTGQPVAGRFYRFTPPSLSFSWSPVTGLDNATSRTPMASGITEPATYNVQMSDGTCLVNGSVNIQVGADVSATRVENCEGQNFTVPVTVHAMKSASSIAITYAVNGGTPITENIATSTVLGPFGIADQVVVSTNRGFPACNTPLGTFFSSCARTVNCDSSTPVVVNYCYGNNDNRQWTFVSSDPTKTLDLKFQQPSPIATGDVISIYSGSAGNNQISAVYYNNDLSTMGDAGLVQSLNDTLTIVISSNGSGSCADNGVTSPWIFRVRCSGCTEPQADVYMTPDCEAGVFQIAAQLWDLGADSLGIPNSSITVGYTVNGGDPILIPEVDMAPLVLGSFPLGTTLELKLLHPMGSSCDNNMGIFGMPWSTCPNDEPCNARLLQMNANYSCTAVTPGTLEGATASEPANACSGTANDDIWFRFTATAPTHRIQLLNVSSATALVHSLYTSSCTNPTLVSGSCTAGNTSDPTGLTPGTLYYVRIHSAGSLAVSTTLNVCVSAPPVVDMRATLLVSPLSTGCHGPAVPVTVTIQNNSWLPLDLATHPVTITATATGGYAGNMVVNTGTLAAGSIMNVTMPQTIDMSAGGTYTFNAATSVAADGNTANDAMAPAVRTVLPMSNLPLSANFEGPPVFDGANLGSSHPGWREGTGATLPSGVTSAWVNSSVLGSTTARINLYTNTRNEWIVGPKFTAQTGTLLKYSIALTDWNSANADPSGMQGTDDRVMVKVSTDCGVTFSTIFTHNAANSVGISNSLVQQIVDLSAYAGQEVIIAFHATDGPVDDLPDYDFHLDNIMIETVEVCAGAPTAGTASLSNAGPSCSPANTTLNLTGYTTGIPGITVQWQRASSDGGVFTDIPGATQPAYIATGLIANTWFRNVVTCSYSNLSSISNTVAITVLPTPVASASNNGPVCSGGSLQLTGGSDIGVSYQWNGPNFNSTQQNPILSPVTGAANGSYRVVATLNGCPSAPAFTNVSVQLPPPLSSVTATPALICEGGTTQLNAMVSNSILITEVTLFRAGTGATSPYPATVGAGDDLVELNNVGVIAVDISGWILSDHPSNSTVVNHSITFPSGTVVPPGGVVVVHLGSGTDVPANRFFNTGGTNLYSSGGAMALMLRNGSTIVDAVALNSATFAAALGVSSAHWSGSASAPSGAAGTVRSASVDSNTGADWVASTTTAQSIGTYNPWYAVHGAPATYAWSPSTYLNDASIASPIATNVTSPITYDVTITSSIGCSTTGSITVTAGSLLAAEITQAATTICQGTATTLTANISGGGTPYTLSWMPGGASTTQITVSPAATTEYTLTVSDVCGGQAISTATVNVNPQPVATASHTAPVCSATALQLTGSTDIGATFTWTGPGGFTNTQQDPSIPAATTAMSGTYTFVATSAVGCPSAPSTTVVNVLPAPVISSVTANPSAICSGGSSQLAVNVIPGTTPVLITEVTLLRTGTGATNPYPAHVTGEDLVELNNISNNAVDLSGWNLSAFGNNSSTASHSITFPTATILPVGGVLVVHLGTGANNAGLLYFNTTTGSSNSYFSGDPVGVVLRSGSTIMDVVGVNTMSFAVATGVTSMHWSGSAPSPSGAAGTIRTATVDSNVGSNWSASTTSLLQTIGTLNNGYVHSPPVLTYNWTPSTFLNDPSSATPIASGVTANTTYTVQVTHPSGCMVTGSVHVTAGEVLATTITPATTDLCQGGSTTLTANISGGGMPYSIVWSPGGATTAQISVSPTVNTEYIVTVTDACGAQTMTPASVNVTALPTATASHVGPVCVGGNLQLNASSSTAAGFSWTGPNNFTSDLASPVIPNATLAASGTYMLTPSLNGCNGSPVSTVVSVGHVPGPVMITPASATICQGDDAGLVASGADVNATGSVQLGGATVAPTQFSTSSPYFRNFENRRTQYIVRATELSGATASTYINSIAFQVTAAPSVNPNNMNGYTIRMRNTTNTDATTQYTGPLTTVFGPVNYSPVAGQNTHVLSTPFLWDGSSNLLIEICFENDPNGTCTNVNNSCWGNDPTVTMVNPGFVSTWAKYADNVAQCAFVGTPSITSSQRPLMTFSYSMPLAATYSWSPAMGLNATSGATVSASPMATTTYTVTGSLANGCTTASTVTVTVDQTDTDDDGILDCVDDCDELPGQNGDICDPGPGFTNGVITDCVCVGSPVASHVEVRSKAVLDGAYLQAEGRMHDKLRGQGLIPSTHPYGGEPFNHTGNETINAGVLALVHLDNSIVDWVLLELRDATTATTVIARRAALIQRDGDIVDLDGTSPVRFNDVATGSYRLAVRHRNHLGVTTANSYALSTIPTDIDLTSSSHPVTSGLINPDQPPAPVLPGRKSITGLDPILAMWAGNAKNDGPRLAYFGAGSDRQEILDVVGSATPFNTFLNVYSVADVNMDGKVEYFGTTSDRQFVLDNVGSSSPFNTLVLPIE